MRQIIYDCETTGFKAGDDRIVSIALVELNDMVPSEAYMHAFANPAPKASSEGALKVHGLTSEFLAGHPKFPQFAASIRDFIGESPLIGHNEKFDRAFLNAEFQAAGYKPLLNPAVCTLALARGAKGQGSYGAGNKLDDLVFQLGIMDLRSATGKHGALIDALLTAQVYFAMRTGSLTSAILDPIARIVKEEYGVGISITGSGRTGILASAKAVAADVRADVRAQRGGDRQDIQRSAAVHNAAATGQSKSVGPAAGDRPGSSRAEIISYASAGLEAALREIR